MNNLVTQLKHTTQEIAHNVNTCLHKLHCMRSGVRDDALSKEQILALLKEAMEVLSKVN